MEFDHSDFNGYYDLFSEIYIKLTIYFHYQRNSEFFILKSDNDDREFSVP